MYKIGKVEFYEDKYSGTVEILKDNKLIKNIEFIVWNNGKIELLDFLDFLDLLSEKLHKEAITRIESKIKSKY